MYAIRSYYGKKKKNDYGIVVEGVDNTLIRFAKCCTPLPGDDIGGYITRGSGIAVHRNDCLNYQNMIQNDPDRQIEVNWDESVIEKKVNRITSYNVCYTKLLR